MKGVRSDASVYGRRPPQAPSSRSVHSAKLHIEEDCRVRPDDDVPPLGSCVAVAWGSPDDHQHALFTVYTRVGEITDSEREAVDTGASKAVYNELAKLFREREMPVRSFDVGCAPDWCRAELAPNKLKELRCLARGGCLTPKR